jgi:AcrR family transcriptional regulator
MARGKRGEGPASNIRGDRPVSSPKAPEPPARPLRADARRNRERVLKVAAEAFAREGLSVSLDEIARRAEVGAGTIHRHFPTKEALIGAVISSRLEALAAEGCALVDDAEPGRAFHAFFTRLVVEGAASHALAAGLAGTAVDIDAVVAAPVRSLLAALGSLLARAQQAGEVRKDLRASDLPALLAGAHAIERHPAGGRRGLAILCDGLRPPAPLAKRPR